MSILSKIYVISYLVLLKSTNPLNLQLIIKVMHLKLVDKNI